MYYEIIVNCTLNYLSNIFCIFNDNLEHYLKFVLMYSTKITEFKILSSDLKSILLQCTSRIYISGQVVKYLYLRQIRK